MKGRDFLDVAFDLVGNLREADWRSAVSRAYYATFHAARDLMSASGFLVPFSDQVHVYLWRRLSHSGHPDIQEAGLLMNHFRGLRNWADYEIDRAMNQQTAFDLVQTVEQVIRLLEDLPSLPDVHGRVVEAMKTYEKGVLKEVTWKK